MEKHASEMAMAIGAKRKLSDAVDATKDGEGVQVSVDGDSEAARLEDESSLRKKPRETSIPSPISGGFQPLDAKKPREKAESEAQKQGEEEQEQDDDPAWILMRALEREIAESARPQHDSTTPVAGTAIAIAEDDDYDESDDDN